MQLIAIMSCLVRGRTDMVHHSLFHGEAVREDKPFPHYPGHHLGDDLSLPLLVSVGANPLQEFFSPGISFVLSSRVRAALAGLPNVDFLPVQFQRLVNLACPVGDFSIPRHTLDLGSSLSFLGKLPQCPHLYPVEPYYELVIANAYRRAAADPTAYRLTVTFPSQTTSDVEIVFNDEILETYPIFWSMATVFRREVFDVLDNLAVLDPDYFTWTQFTV